MSLYNRSVEPFENWRVAKIQIEIMKTQRYIHKLAAAGRWDDRASEYLYKLQMEFARR